MASIDVMDKIEQKDSTAVQSLLLSDEVSAEIAGMLERVAPSVVQVFREGRGGGAGVVWRADGGIMTNYHVVAGRGGEISVLFPDGRSLPARIANQNPALDLALLEVEAEDLPAALVDDSSKLRIGELVFAVGHPWGHRNVVTAGIVSATGEVPIPNSGTTAQYIRSDVRVAPGNSGGPLLNAQGAVVGITAMIFGGDLTVAIPSKVAIDWVGGLPSRRVYLGVGVQPVELPITVRQREKAVQAAGLLVVDIDQKGPAHKAGLLVGDVLLDVLAQHASNEEAHDIQLHVMRGGVVQAVNVDLSPPESSETSA